MYLSRPPCGARHARRVIDVAVDTVPVVLRPQAALSEMLPVRSAAGLNGTPNERSRVTVRVPLRVSWAAAGGVAGAKRALPKG